MKITNEVVMDYIAECAESIIEDDTNESGRYTDEEHRELVKLAMKWIYENKKW